MVFVIFRAFIFLVVLLLCFTTKLVGLTSNNLLYKTSIFCYFCIKTKVKEKKRNIKTLELYPKILRPKFI